MSDLENNFNEWEDPYFFEDFKLTDWPDQVLPGDADEFAIELARSTETPIELSSMMCFGAIASACHKKYKVSVSKSYSEPLNIWVLAILPPGSRKTAVFAEVFFAIYEGEIAIRRKMEIDCRKKNIRYKIKEERVKHLTRSAAHQKTADIDDLESQILTLEKEMSSLASIPQIWSGDVTPENLATIMSANDEAMAVLSDEGGIFDILAGLYSKGNANIDLFLQGHSGSPVRVNRQSKDPILLNKAIITMALTVQPEVIQKALINRKFRGRGLMARFLYVYPRSNIGSRTLGQPPLNEGVKNRFKQAILAILDHPYREDKTFHNLELEEGAYKKWLDYSRAIEKMMEPDLGYLCYIKDWASKLSGQILRLAGLIHVYRYANQRPWEQKISFEDMEKAVKVGHALISHSLKVFGSSTEDEGEFTAKMILKWIQDNKIEQFTRRKLLRGNRSLNKNEAMKGLEVLKDRNFIHEWKYQREQGPPSMAYNVNPKAHT